MTGRSLVVALAAIALPTGVTAQLEAGRSGSGGADLRVALTFDDLPGQSTVRTTGTYAELNRAILESLRQVGAPAVGFVNESKLYEDDALLGPRVDVLAWWLEAGHQLGNHTWSHPDLHTTPVDRWLADLERGEAVIRELAAEHGSPFGWFRHPMLHTGRTLEVKTAVSERLDALGYRIAPVTIDNGEWIFARAYDVALDRDDGALAERIAATYVAYMDSVFAYYEVQSEAILGYRIPQVLLLHANRLNARALTALLEAVSERGYRWVTLEEALEDPAYDRPDTYLGPAGITWLHRWALADGHRGAFFAGEPEVPDWVMEVSGL